MKTLKLAATVLTLAGIGVLTFGCSASSSQAATTKTVTATVTRGDISVSITGTGNLAYARAENVAFQMAGTVEEVMVEEGQSVEQGAELARLDMSEWSQQVKVIGKQVVSAEHALAVAERQISGKEMAVRQAELDLQTATESLERVPAVKAAQDLVDMAEGSLKAAQAMYGMNPAVTSVQIQAIQQQLAEAQQNLRAVLAGTSYTATGDIALQIARVQFQIEQSQMQLDEARVAVEDAKSARDDAELTLADAHAAFAEANALSPVITAPFSGFITSINVQGGDEVQKGTVALQLADPAQIEANIQVVEQDVFSVKTGGNAVVAVDSLEGLTFPAIITAVAPRATISQGVVSYKVTVKLTSLQPAAGAQGGAVRTAQSSNATSPQFAGPASVTGPGPSAAVSLRDGLSVTVDIIVQQAGGVLLVPTRAITRQGPSATVQVVSGAATEIRTVITGVSDDQNTEISGGLSEGEQVVYTVSSSSSSTSTASQRQQQVVPGLGGVGGPPPGGF